MRIYRAHIPGVLYFFNFVKTKGRIGDETIEFGNGYRLGEY